MISPNVALIGSLLLFLTSLITLFVGSQLRKAQTKNQEADTLTKLLDAVDKAQQRADELYNEKVACEVSSEKLRGDLAIALVQSADQQKEIANLKGYIQGLTDPLIKLEQAQKAALAGGRRETDKK